MTALACERARFAVPEGSTHLDRACLSPPLDTMRAAGHPGLDRMDEPWRIRRGQFFDEVLAVRGRFAALVDGPAEDVAILPSTSYGTAALLARIDRGCAVVASPARHRSDGSAADLEALGAALVAHATPGPGAVPLEVGRVRPDFLVASARR